MLTILSVVMSCLTLASSTNRSVPLQCIVLDIKTVINKVISNVYLAESVTLFHMSISDTRLHVQHLHYTYITTDT